MRNGLPWGAYVKAARENAGLSRPKFAAAVGVGRTTVWRWEEGNQRPENAQIVGEVARVTGVDINEALAAAGLRPGTDAPSGQPPPPPIDPDVQIILNRLADPRVTADEKRLIRAQLRHLADLADHLTRARDDA